MSKKRNYTGSDSEMLTTCDTIIDHAIDCGEFLRTKRPGWTDRFFSTVKIRIAYGFSELLGVSGANALTGSTADLVALQAEAKTLLSEIKVSIEVDFTKNPVRRDQLLSLLGFTLLNKEVKSNSQQSLIELLFKFKKEFTPELKVELLEKGGTATALDRILELATLFSEANTTQESNKGTRKEITGAAVDGLNDIYDEVIGIAKLASSYYKDDNLKKEYFSYSKVLSNLKVAPRLPKGDDQK